jgi:hypothetical protein
VHHGVQNGWYFAWMMIQFFLIFDAGYEKKIEQYYIELNVFCQLLGGR